MIPALFALAVVAWIAWQDLRGPQIPPAPVNPLDRWR